MSCINLIRGALTALVLLAVLSSVPVVAQNPETRAETLKRHVVAIFDEDGALLGAGASVSASGLILTAKHILEQNVTGSAPTYRVSVEILAQRDMKRRPATLVATHPHLDLAILAVPSEGELIPPLLVGTPQTDGATDWYAIGHPIGATNDRLKPKLFVTITGTWTGVERRSGMFVMPGEAFDTGMSGGPVILGDRIIGVASYSQNKRAYVVPVSEALDYFNLLGFATSPAGLLERSDHVGKLTAKIDTYEAILSDIQADRRWFCALKAVQDKTDGLPETLDLTVSSLRRLPSQPELSAKLSMTFSAEVDVPGGNINPLADVEGGFKYVTEDNSAAVFNDVIQALHYKMSGTPIDADQAQLKQLSFNISVSGITGNFIRTTDLPEYSVCCAFALSPDEWSDDGTQLLQIEAEHCPELSDETSGGPGE